MTNINFSTRRNGFTLVEMAIVLLIVTLLLTGLVPTISSQIEQRQRNETRKQLDEIQQALIGFAVINGRLPCPASSTSNGLEDPIGTGICNHPHDGFVPAATLGLAQVNSQGLAVDAWNNPIHYAVTTSNSKAFTKPNGMGTTGISNLQPDLMVCSTASASNTTCSVANSSLTASPGVPALIYSTGKNGGYGGAGADEAENPNPHSPDNDPVFVSHPPAPTTAVNGGFDDIVTWISPNVLINRMVEAGKLP